MNQIFSGWRAFHKESRSIRTQNMGCPQRRGATLILMLFLMVVIVGMAAFAIDIGRMQLVRSQLQTAVDAGALAGGLQLKQNPNNVAAAQQVAEDFIQQNRVGFMVTVPSDSIAVDVGEWDAKAGKFHTKTSAPNSIRVLANQGNEPFMLAKVFGRSTFSIPRQAIVASGDGKLDILLVLDVTGSMSSDGRIEALHFAAPTFVNVIQSLSTDDRIGVMGYGAIKGVYDPVAAGHNGVVYTATPAELFPTPSEYANGRVAVLEGPLTANFQSLKDNVLNPGTLIAGKYSGGTPIGAAIRDSAHYLDNNARSNVRRIMVVMSDGDATHPVGNESGYALAMTNYAVGLGITVHAVSLGNSANTSLMTAIADAGQGTHFVATGTGSQLAAALDTTFRSLAYDIKRTTLVE